ncbi:hypothetical protein LXA43DRAFT_896796 [Ganoderma leucocontextum]|nr:hypothetical protein LXA43DRAFT_896796 [Ganoderma leucocontextum]
MCAVSSLPPEIWRFIIDLLPRRDHRTCLFLSKVHHDIAFSNMFSHVTVTFGLWRWRGIPADQFNIQPNDEDDDYRRMVRRNGLTWDILRAISGRPDFAKVVREFTVRAHAWEGGEHFLEKRCLIQALKVLPNLRVFHWYGQRPAPSSEIFEALATGSSTTLTELHMPFVDLWPAMHADEIPYHKTVQETIAANAATLRRLDVFGDVLWECPSPSFANLHELTIVFPNTFDGLGSVFEHCRGLGGFTLCMENDGMELAEVVKTHPDAFPNLTSFKLLSVFDLPDEAVEEVAKFLKKKKLLRRVDVITRTEAQAREALVNVSLLKILPELPRLEVLGLDIRPAKLTAAHVKLLQQYVPRQVTALFILFQSGSSDAKVADWRNFVSEHDALRYLHIATRSLGNAIFKRPPPALELLGYNNGMRWVTHNPTTYSGFWPHAKMYFRTVEDYDGCEDWEWLLRHHGQDDDDCDIWSMSPPDAWKRMDAEVF